MRTKTSDTAEDWRGDELPEGLSTRKKRLATIQAAMKRLEERQMAADKEAGRNTKDHKPGCGKKPFKRPMGEPKPTAQDNFTDPESRIMKTSTEGFPAMLQRASGGGFPGPDHRGNNGD